MYRQFSSDNQCSNALWMIFGGLQKHLHEAQVKIKIKTQQIDHVLIYNHINLF